MSVALYREIEMRKLLACFAGLVGLLCLSAPASAVPTVTMPISDFDGSFGSFSQVVSGDFSTAWTFTIPADSLASSSLTAAKVTFTTGIGFSNVTLNGSALGYSLIGGTQLYSIDDLFVSAGTQTLLVEGTGHGSYGGSVSIAPVPEPATWAMMLFGFGGIAMTMRRSRKTHSISFA